MHKRSWIASTLCLIWLLPGCATQESGYKISDETIAFIQPGVTMRAEVVENLGPPLLELKDLRVVAYSWGKLRATGSRAPEQQGLQTGSMGNAGGPPSDDSGLVETRRWICCIALDDKDRVTRVERVAMEGATSLENAVRQWANRSR
jgi:hypothetical protein